MEKVEVKVELPKETYELCKALGAVAAATKQALADGFQIGTDMPAIITSAVMELVPAIQGVDKLDDEAKADPVGVAQAVIEGLRPVFKKA